MDQIDQVALDGAELESSLAAIPPAPGEQPAAASPAAAVSAEEQSKIETYAAIPKMLGSALCLALPELKEAYSDERCLAWGADFHKVAKKRGWDVGESAPELALALSTLGLFVLPTSVVLYQRMAAKKKEKPTPADTSAAGGAAAAATATAGEEISAP